MALSCITRLHLELLARPFRIGTLTTIESSLLETLCRYISSSVQDFAAATCPLLAPVPPTRGHMTWRASDMASSFMLYFEVNWFHLFEAPKEIWVLVVVWPLQPLSILFSLGARLALACSAGHRHRFSRTIYVWP